MNQENIFFLFVHSVHAIDKKKKRSRKDDDSNKTAMIFERKRNRKRNKRARTIYKSAAKTCNIYLEI